MFLYTVLTYSRDLDQDGGIFHSSHLTQAANPNVSTSFYVGPQTDSDGRFFTGNRKKYDSYLFFLLFSCSGGCSFLHIFLSSFFLWLILHRYSLDLLSDCYNTIVLPIVLSSSRRYPPVQHAHTSEPSRFWELTHGADPSVLFPSPMASFRTADRAQTTSGAFTLDASSATRGLVKLSASQSLSEYMTRNEAELLQRTLKQARRINFDNERAAALSSGDAEQSQGQQQQQEQRRGLGGDRGRKRSASAPPRSGSRGGSRSLLGRRGINSNASDNMAFVLQRGGGEGGGGGGSGASSVASGAASERDSATSAGGTSRASSNYSRSGLTHSGTSAMNSTDASYVNKLQTAAKIERWASGSLAEYFVARENITPPAPSAPAPAPAGRASVGTEKRGESPVRYNKTLLRRQRSESVGQYGGSNSVSQSAPFATSLNAPL
jgi:hypothetical protein